MVEEFYLISRLFAQETEPFPESYEFSRELKLLYNSVKNMATDFALSGKLIN